MKQEHSFDAKYVLTASFSLFTNQPRPKQYKERFKSWGWRKNVSGHEAQWMVNKANKRKNEEKKETVFIIGGSKWYKTDAERSAKRSKKSQREFDVMGE